MPLTVPNQQFQVTEHLLLLLQPFYDSGFCPGQPRWAGTRRNIYPLTPTMVSWSIIPYLLPPSVTIHKVTLNSLDKASCSIYMPDSLFFTISVQASLNLLLCLAPSSSYAIHFFTQSLSYFRSMCPHHRTLFCCSTKIMSFNPSLCLNPLLGTLIA